MINIKQELLSYSPVNIDRLTGEDSPLPDNIKASITLYNKALSNIKLGSEDIAIIELKKVLSLNPDFYEASNLLGACYIYTKQYTKAVEVLEKITSIEKNGIKALSYIEYMNNIGLAVPKIESDTIPKISGSKGKEGSKSKESSKSKDLKKDNNKILYTFRDMPRLLNMSVVKYAACFAAGIIIMMLLMMVFGSKAEKKPLDDVVSKAKVGSLTAKKDSEIKKLSEENNELKSQLKASSGELGYFKNISKLFDIEKQYEANNIEAAADGIVLLKSVQFKEPEKSKCESLKGNVLPKAAWAVFNDGNNLMWQGKYQDAINKLNKVQIYGDNWAYLNIAMYNIGLCYKEMNDTRSAVNMFNKVIEKYPDTDYGNMAKCRISELNGEP